MNRLTYWGLIILVSGLGGIVVNYFKLGESFSKGFIFFLVLFFIPVLAVIRMKSLGMTPIEMLQSIYNRKLRFKRMFGKNTD